MIIACHVVVSVMGFIKIKPPAISKNPKESDTSLKLVTSLRLSAFSTACISESRVYSYSYRLRRGV